MLSAGIGSQSVNQHLNSVTKNPLSKDLMWKHSSNQTVMIRWADKTQGRREKTNVQTVAYIRHRSLKLFVLLLCELVWTTVYSTEYCSTQCVWVYMLIVSVVVIGNIRPGKIRTVKNVNTVGGNKIWSVTKFTEEFRRVDEVLGGLKHHSHATHTHTKCNGAFKRSLSTLNAWNRLQIPLTNFPVLADLTFFWVRICCRAITIFWSIN